MQAVGAAAEDRDQLGRVPPEPAVQPLVEAVAAGPVQTAVGEVVGDPLPLSAVERSCGCPVLRRDGPGLIRWCGAGLTVLRLLPTGVGLPAGSTSCHRATPGGYCHPGRDGGEVAEVACGVDIPIQGHTTHGARVRPLTQGQLGFHRTTA